MNRSEIEQNILMGLVVSIMLGALWFFYDKTQAVDLREQNEVMSLLNEVKEIDGRWDMEVQRARIDLGGQDMPAVRTDSGEKALRDITRFAGLTSSKALRSGLPELRSAIQLKSELVQQFLSENRANKAMLQDLMGAVAELTAQQRTQKSSPSLLQVLSRLGETAPQYFLHGEESRQLILQDSVAQLGTLLPGSNEQARIATAVQSLLEHVPVELGHFTRLEGLSTGPRLINLTLSFNSELEDALQEKERYRIYLVYYASALLVLLIYFGARLRAANQTLEHRVEARTRELSDALKHLKESETQLIQSEKMSSLGQMVAGVAHEINTPLAYVKNSLGQVSEQLPAIGDTLDHCDKLLEFLRAGDDAEGLSREFQQTSMLLGTLKQQHVIEELSKLVKDGLFGTGQVSEIVGNLKNFSRLDRSKVAHTNLNESLNNTLLLAKHQLKSVKVVKNFGAIPEITCAPSQINQVFLNLVTNAIQAMPGEHGTLTLTSRADGEGVAVDVEDDGSGIPAEVMSKIFDPFFTTKEVGKGTGLGLSISYKIIQQHGGRISVDSKPNVGTKFTVWLPLTPPDEAQLEG
ncbi:adaptive-response sensory-kinase SasA [Sideroxyarcus emersonii]|uniref:histidine kinase n=1 Tax=Sideroxyarcus emersonii TaxID=2764705 RepID=A0AAN2BXR5_9PROT|nr:ATP-binding protein [Sideroxyarcus emersonii]BCK86424.1 adaptive-response sensory-kinase SasA [Sideroxyarcus emersonii]